MNVALLVFDFHNNVERYINNLKVRQTAIRFYKTKTPGINNMPGVLMIHESQNITLSFY